MGVKGSSCPATKRKQKEQDVSERYPASPSVCINAICGQLQPNNNNNYNNNRNENTCNMARNKNSYK